MNEEVMTQDTAVQAPTAEQKREQNLIAMRLKLEREEEARKAAERRAEEAYKRLQELEQAAQQQPQRTQRSYDDDDVDPDDYVTGKHVRKYKEEIQETRQTLEALQQQIAMLEASQAVQDKSDFYQVVNDDNLALLRRLYPDDYNTLFRNTNIKERTRAAYNMIKNYGIIDRQVTEAKQRLEENKSRPQASATAPAQVSQTPLATMGEHERRVLTDEQRKQIMRRLEERRRMG